MLLISPRTADIAARGCHLFWHVQRAISLFICACVNLDMNIHTSSPTPLFAKFCLVCQPNEGPWCQIECALLSRTGLSPLKRVAFNYLSPNSDTQSDTQYDRQTDRQSDNGSRCGAVKCLGLHKWRFCLCSALESFELWPNIYYYMCRLYTIRVDMSVCILCVEIKP